MHTLYYYILILAGVVAKVMGLSCGGAHGHSLKRVQKTDTMCTSSKDPSIKLMSCQVLS